MNSCSYCDKERVCDYPECDAVKADFPELDPARIHGTIFDRLTVEFKKAQRLRCEFVAWLTHLRLVKIEAIEPGSDWTVETILPCVKDRDGNEVKIELRPAAQRALEDDLIAQALDLSHRNVSSSAIHSVLDSQIAEYGGRVYNYLWKQKGYLLGKVPFQREGI